MNTSLLIASLGVALAVCGSAHAAVVASDDANNADYAPQPNHNWSVINGGFGYNLWTPLGGAGGGGTYMEGVGVNNRQVAGNFSFALYAGGGTYAISRPLTSSMASGEFDILTRFDLAGAGPNLVNLRTGNNVAGFGNGELLSFGIVNGNTLGYTDGTGFHAMASGEARGSVWSWDVIFDASAGSYTLSVTNLGGGYSAVVGGNLDANNTSVGSFGVINSSAGGNQNLIFGAAQFSTVPEPSAMALLSVGAVGWLSLRRRKA
jgi:hypothetical protein